MTFNTLQDNKRYQVRDIDGDLVTASHDQYKALASALGYTKTRGGVFEVWDCLRPYKPVVVALVSEVDLCHIGSNMSQKSSAVGSLLLSL